MQSSKIITDLKNYSIQEFFRKYEKNNFNFLIEEQKEIEELFEEQLFPIKQKPTEFSIDQQQLFWIHLSFKNGLFNEINNLVLKKLQHNIFEEDEKMKSIQLPSFFLLKHPKILLNWISLKIEKEKKFIDLLINYISKKDAQNFDWNSLEFLGDLDSHFSSLGGLHSIIKALMMRDDTTERGTDLLNQKATYVLQISQHLELIIWFFEHNLLPESSEQKEFLQTISHSYQKTRNKLSNFSEKKIFKDDINPNSFNSQLFLEILFADLFPSENIQSFLQNLSFTNLIELYHKTISKEENIENLNSKRNLTQLWIIYYLLQFFNPFNPKLSESFANCFILDNFSQKFISGCWLLDNENFEDAHFLLSDPFIYRAVYVSRLMDLKFIQEKIFTTFYFYKKYKETLQLMNLFESLNSNSN
ncbi:elys protein [Anaeramoeba ignava]|uniref:Elys protein n=1 Tax=Anaeramoeba ignava TaxID=1746090 RepID=A0A9Q0LAY5_ANAIG|nr:elys protein [Anaeramoeba ignava]